MENKREPQTLVEMVNIHQQVLEVQEDYIAQMSKKYNRNFQILHEEIVSLQKENKKNGIFIFIWGVVTAYLLYHWIVK